MYEIVRKKEVKFSFSKEQHINQVNVFFHINSLNKIVAESHQALLLSSIYAAPTRWKNEET